MATRRVFRTRSFTRWMRKAGLTDEALCNAVVEMAQGLIDADLGGHLLKKRLALPGQGKRGGARTIVATKTADRWFFVLGFAKNEPRWPPQTAPLVAGQTAPGRTVEL